jgi:HEAT repeat protein/predicted transcriptional regulator
VFLLENLAVLLVWLLSTIVAVNLTFLFFVLYRRFSRRRFYQAKDAARTRYTPAINSFLDQSISVENAAAVLLTAQHKAEQVAIQESVLARVGSGNARRLTELLFAIGLVEHWARQAFGKRRAAILLDYALHRRASAPPPARTGRLRRVVRRLRVSSVPRFLAMARLSNLDPGFVRPMLADGLLDPAAEVRRAAVLALGHSGNGDALPLLFEELCRAIEGRNEVSLRTAKAALANYGQPQVSEFVPWLKHSSTRVRFLTLNIASEICRRAARTIVLNKNDFSPEFYATVLELTLDADADVRAQSAEVVPHFGDVGAIATLQRLMTDEDQYVRLHAVRAAARFVELMPTLVRCVSDSRWRVRQAAVKTLGGFGSTGINELYRCFASTSDTYSREQIADEIQLGGIMQDLVAGLASSGADYDLAIAVSRRMVDMGKTSLLITALATARTPKVQVALMHELVAAPSEELRTIVALLAETETGVVRETARATMRQIERSEARARGGAA